jgi:hypothetical protein
VDPALLERAMTVRGERAEVAVDTPSFSENGREEERTNSHAHARSSATGRARLAAPAKAKARSDAAKLAPVPASSTEQPRQPQQPESKAAKKNAARAKKRGEANAQAVAEIHAALFR